MKTYIVSKVPAGSKFTLGAALPLEDAEFAAMTASGHELSSEREWAAVTARQKAEKTAITSAVDRAAKRGALVLQGDAANSVEKVTAKCLDQITKGADVEFVVETLDGMAGKDEQVLTSRLTQFHNEENENVLARSRGDLRVGRCDPIDAAIKSCKLQDEQFALIKAGKCKEATEKAIDSTAILSREIMPLVRASLSGQQDWTLREMVRASDVTDGNVGTLAGSLVLMRNLGFLKNMLNFLHFISTDLRNEPATYNQPVFTRYITPPSVTAFNTSTGWADSTASTTDTSVTINKHNGVQITFDTQLLGSTVRALLSEQVGAQTYALAEQIAKDFLVSLTGAAWDGVVNKTSIGSYGAFGLPSLVALKNRATLAKMPPMGRFLLLHSSYHDGILLDGNLVTAKAITALVNKDQSAFESAELPVLYGLHPLESQLFAYTTTAVNGSTASTGIVTAGTAGTGTAAPPTIDANGNVTFGANTLVGFLGTISSMLMVARIPQDYTQAFKDIPATAAIQVVTDPDTGLSMLNCKYVNHQTAKVSNRLSLMYGFAPGDLRQGLMLTN